jgi:hypothetical protein
LIGDEADKLGLAKVPDEWETWGNVISPIRSSFRTVRRPLIMILLKLNKNICITYAELKYKNLMKIFNKLLRSQASSLKLNY